MDPVAIKFVQLIFAEVLGAGLATAGVVLFLRGVAGKSSLVIQGAGIEAKLLNAAPGGIVLIAGVIIVALSLNSSVERTERTTEFSSVSDEWLANSLRVTDSMNFKSVIDTIVGIAPNTRFVSRTVRVNSNTTLGVLAKQELKDEKYWPLLAAINKDQGFFTMKTARADTPIGAGTVLSVWEPSRYNNRDIQTISKIAGQDRGKAYDELLAFATSRAEFATSEPEFSADFKRRELEVLFQTANLSGVRTLRELSLKYYSDAKYWPLIVWANPEAFPANAEEETTLPSDKTLTVVTLASGTHIDLG